MKPSIIINDYEQRSDEWFEAHRGVLSGTSMKTLMIGSPDAKNKLLDKMRAQIADPTISMGGGMASSPSLNWGIDNEPEAIAQYELRYDCDVDQPAFVIHGDYDFIGCSPDFIHGRVVGEVKCPYDKDNHHLNVVLGSQINQYKPQIMCELLVTDCDVNRFISYDPRYKDIKNRFHLRELPRDEKYIADMERRAIEFKRLLDNGEYYESLSNLTVIPQLF